VLLATVVHKTSCHGVQSAAPCPEPGAKAESIPLTAGGQGGVGSTSAHATPCRSRAWLGIALVLTHALPMGLNLRCTPRWERPVVLGGGGRAPLRALGKAPGCVCLWEKKTVMSQSRLSGRINLVMAHVGDTPVGCDGRKRILQDLRELEKVFTKAGRRSSFPDMLNADLILKASLDSLVPWSEGSYYFYFFS